MSVEMHVDVPEARGVLYVAFGWPYLLLAFASIRSLRNESPGLPITVATAPSLIQALPDELLGLVDEWRALDLPATENRAVKTSADLHVGYQRTVMLDADTLVVGDLRPMFDWLDHFDVGFKLNEARLGSAGNVEKGAAPVLDGRWTVDDLPHWNGAVCLFRKSHETRSFFETWNRRFAEIGSPYDQVSLVDALFLTPVRLLSFDYRWNSPMKSFRNVRKGSDVVIVHYGSDFPESVLDSARRDAALVSGKHPEAQAELEQFLTKRAAARAEKNAHLGLKQSRSEARSRRWFRRLRALQLPRLG